MEKVVTITLNPSIDITTSVPAFIPDKKLYCTTPTKKAGGGGINVARVITRLGKKATALFPAGGYNGNYLTELLTAEGVTCIPVITQNNIRENMMITDMAHQAQYQFILPGATLYKNEWEELIGQLEKIPDAGFFVLSGSLPPGVPVEVYSRIASVAYQRNIKLIADASGEALQELVQQGGIYLLKPNLGELSKLHGVASLDLNNAVQAGKDMIKRGCCEVLVVSLGAAGALLITEYLTEHILSPLVKKKNTVGAGDSLLAGIIVSLTEGKSLTASVRFGVACGAAATIHEGTDLCSLPDVQSLLAGMLPIPEALLPNN